MSEQSKNKNIEEELNEKNTYSYHTFILPFYYGKKGDVKAIDDSVLSEDLPISEYLTASDCKAYFNKKANVAYNVTSYFTDSANKLICSNKDLLKVYVLKEQYLPAKYIIKKNGLPYSLDVFNIKLKLYSNGIGLLIYELKNEKHRSLDCVNRINELGRRIRAPFLDAKDQCFLVADEIEIQFDSDEAKINSNFIVENKKYDQKSVPQVVKQLIFSEGSDWQIAAVDDDRMFVCCLVRDDNWSQKISQVKDGHRFTFSEKEQLYKLAYIEEDCSCQSEKMIDQILNRTMYDRWINYGTCDFITNHSFVRLTSSNKTIVDKVINPFLFQYVEFATIALLQRATIKKVLDNLSKNTKNINISKISQYYSNQKSEVLFSKVTFQEQGDEEYKIVRQELDIDEMKAECDNHLAALYNHFNTELQRKANTIIIVLTVVIMILTILSIMTSFCSLKIDCVEKLKPFIFFIALFMGVIGVIFITSAYFSVFGRPPKER